MLSAAKSAPVAFVTRGLLFNIADAVNKIGLAVFALPAARSAARGREIKDATASLQSGVFYGCSGLNAEPNRAARVSKALVLKTLLSQGLGKPRLLGLTKKPVVKCEMRPALWMG